MNLKFYKYQGTGNDFILIDSTHSDIHLSKDQIEKLCHRRFGIGADGLMILRKKEGYDFDMDFYNSDGNQGSMCGNGGRCIVAFAHDLKLIQTQCKFWAPDGEHEAIFHNHDHIALKMINVAKIEQHLHGLFMDTGSPHLVIQKQNDDDLNVIEKGRTIRYSDEYKEGGVNVNFVIPNNKESKIYTYERGVEDQTYSCGTGTVASALALHKIKKYASPIHFITLGGNLSVNFDNTGDDKYENIWLNGPAIQTFSGECTV